MTRRGQTTCGQLMAALAVCTGLGLFPGACAPDRLGDQDSDVGGNNQMMLPPGERMCVHDADCGSSGRCVDSGCVPDNGTCATDDDCQNDTYCACPPLIQASGCACLQWGHKPRGKGDDMCSGQAFEPGEFKNPILKCQWPPTGMDSAYHNVISTPLVIDLENDGQPEIVFAAGYPGQAHLVAMSGKDCTVKWDRATNISTCTNIAAADLDGDGKVEIVALATGTTVFDYQGNVKASLSTPPTTGCSQDYPPAIANLDGDGKLEVITGNQVYDGTTGMPKPKSIMSGLGGGYPAIGDFNGDGHPDIVLVSSASGGQKVQVIDYFNNAFIMPPTAATNGWGGAPTVADFDGDGHPEFATASAINYYVYSPDCLKSPKPAKCHGTDPGVLWQSSTQDSSSGSTGSSVFDFNGDGIAEVVYRDECWLRVYNGPDGKKLFAAPVSSGTDLEMPVIADTDGDGHADIVVSSDDVQGNNCTTGVSAMELGMPHGPPTFGIKVFTDPMDRWMPSRSIWNQHAYHITNINDNGTVPLMEMPNFKTYNNYRQNVQGSVAGKAPTGDATGNIVIAPDVGDCVKLFRVAGNVCNRGAAPMGAGLPATFYLGDPRTMGAMAICTSHTTKQLQVGDCEQVVCDWNNPPPGPFDLWFRVNDDGAGHHPDGECKSGNDLAHIPHAACSMIPG